MDLSLIWLSPLIEGSLPPCGGGTGRVQTGMIGNTLNRDDW